MRRAPPGTSEKPAHLGWLASGGEGPRRPQPQRDIAETPHGPGSASALQPPSPRCPRRAGRAGSPRVMLSARAMWPNSRPSCCRPSSASSATSLLHSRSSASWFPVVTARGSARSCRSGRGVRLLPPLSTRTRDPPSEPHPALGAACHGPRVLPQLCPPRERPAPRGPDTPGPWREQLGRGLQPPCLHCTTPARPSPPAPRT